MKILFDFLAIYQKNGAAEYTRRVFYALLDRIEHAAHTDDITITCLFDSHHLPAYTEMRPDSLRHKYVDFVDIQNGISAINAFRFVHLVACKGGSVFLGNGAPCQPF